jgi:hypothetical protein
MYAALMTWFLRRPDDGPIGTETCSLPFIKYDVHDENCFIILVIKYIIFKPQNKRRRLRVKYIYLHFTLSFKYNVFTTWRWPERPKHVYIVLKGLIKFVGFDCNTLIKFIDFPNFQYIMLLIPFGMWGKYVRFLMYGRELCISHKTLKYKLM